MSKFPVANFYIGGYNCRPRTILCQAASSNVHHFPDPMRAGDFHLQRPANSLDVLDVVGCNVMWCNGIKQRSRSKPRSHIAFVGSVDMTHALDSSADSQPLFGPVARPAEDAVQVVPVFQLALSDLKQRIRMGEWLPGERLPSIAQLARDLNISTGSVREALRSLQSLGLVKIEHGRGVFVVGPRPWTEVASQFEDVSIGLIAALAETRRILEPELAALA